MNNKGQIFQTVIKMALGLVLFMIAWYMITGYTGGFTKSTNSCKAHGGICKTPCSDTGETIWYPGNPSCEIEGGVCCTSDEITRLAQQNELPMYDDGITVGVSYVDILSGEANPIRESFRNGQSIPLFVGGAYNFDIRVNRAAFRNEEFGCEITIKNTRFKTTPTLRDSDGSLVSASYTDNECFQESDDPLLEIGNNDGQLNFKSVKFDGAQKDNPYELEIKIYNGAVGSDLIVKASFPLNLQLPVSVRGLNGEWSKLQTLTVTCNGISCKSFDIGFIGVDENGAFVCKQERFRRENPYLFESEELEVTLNEESFVFGQDKKIINNHTCLGAVLENDDAIVWTPREKLKMDFEPPVTKGIERNKAICEDVEGSGCKRVHYIVYVDYTMEDFEREKLRGLEQQFKETLNGFLSNKLAAFLYREEGGACPPKGSREYSVSNDFLLNMQSAIIGNICIYSEDNVGNEEDPQMKVIYDLDIVERPTIEGISDDVIEGLTGLPRPSSTQ